MPGKTICLNIRLRHEWRRQMKLRDQRQQLIVEHMPVVEKVARSLRHKLPAQVPFQDLVQAGHVGLCEAAGRYDPSQGSFERYAYRRVRGAIIDSLKRRAYREENHESFDAIMEQRGYLPPELQIDRNGELPDALTLRNERLKLLKERVERLPDHERDVLWEAVCGVDLAVSAQRRGKSIAWTRTVLATARDKVAFKKAA